MIHVYEIQKKKKIYYKNKKKNRESKSRNVSDKLSTKKYNKPLPSVIKYKINRQVQDN